LKDLLEALRTDRELRGTFIATIRSVAEGGASELSDSERLVLLAEIALSGQISYCDLELATIRGRLSLPSKQLIVSVHDFKGRPERLYNLVDELNHSFSTVNKIVWTARTLRDNIEAFEILQQRQQPAIALYIGA